MQDKQGEPRILPQKLGEIRLVADGCVALEASVKCLVGTAYCFSFVAVMPHRPQHRKKLASLEIPEELVQCSPRPSPRPAYSLRRVQEEFPRCRNGFTLDKFFPLSWTQFPPCTRWEAQMVPASPGFSEALSPVTSCSIRMLPGPSTCPYFLPVGVQSG